MGKNTLMKRCIRLYNERTGSDTWAPLLDALVGNVGLVFTKGDLSEASLLASGLFSSSTLLCRILIGKRSIAPQ